MMAGPLETVVLASLAFWGVFYLLNYADLFAKLRAAVIPALPRWLAYALQCAFCTSSWVLVAFSLFVGFTPLLLWVPPTCLFIDMGYRRLAANPPAGEVK